MHIHRYIFTVVFAFGVTAVAMAAQTASSKSSASVQKAASCQPDSSSQAGLVAGCVDDKACVSLVNGNNVCKRVAKPAGGANCLVDAAQLSNWKKFCAGRNQATCVTKGTAWPCQWR